MDSKYQLKDREWEQTIPDPNDAHHKGQNGKILVIGGSEAYTGAPYFSAMAALRTGADLAHVVCERSAATVIKTYSPDLIVYPYLEASDEEEFAGDELWSGDEQAQISKTVRKVKSLLKRVDSVVVGPGLGRDPLTLESVSRIVDEAKQLCLPLVFDADGLFLIKTRPDLIKGYPLAVLTPNVVEFSRLCDAVGLKVENKVTAGDDLSNEEAYEAVANTCKKLAAALGGVTVVEKGRVDVISDGRRALVCEAEGGGKRCGGQGDLLSGATAVNFLWALRHARGNQGGQEEQHSSGNHLINSVNESGTPASLVGAWIACNSVRNSSMCAFNSEGRRVLASDMLQHLW